MGYEGRIQVIDCYGNYDLDDDSIGNSYKRRKHDVWLNRIDDTNYDGYGEVPVEILNKFYRTKEAKYQTCNLGHNHRISNDVYRIPGEEARYLRHKSTSNWEEPDSRFMNQEPLYPQELKRLQEELAKGEVFGAEPLPKIVI